MNQIWLLGTDIGAKLSQGQTVTAALRSAAGAWSHFLPEKIIQPLLLLVRIKIKTSANQHVCGSRAAKRSDRRPEGCLPVEGRCTANHRRRTGPRPATAQHAVQERNTKHGKRQAPADGQNYSAGVFFKDCRAGDTRGSHPSSMLLTNFRRLRSRLDFAASNLIMSAKTVCPFASASLNVTEGFSSFTPPTASSDFMIANAPGYTVWHLHYASFPDVKEIFLVGQRSRRYGKRSAITAKSGK